MHKETRFSWTCQLHMRRLALALVLIAAVTISVAAGAATAQSTGLDATVKGPTHGEGQKPNGCPGGAFLCGEAAIAGFGSGDYRFYFTSRPRIVPAGCGDYDAVDYTALVTFTLEDGSVLALDEVGRACGQGNSFSPSTPSFGNPVDGSGTWQVRDGTGQFVGLSGSGTDTFHNAGAHLAAHYTGDLAG